MIDSRVGDGATLLHCYAKEADVGDRVSVGPFAYLRPGATLREGSKAGTFVEIKNSDIGRGTKVPHLSYIGDADIGEGTNIGAGTITANYDGYRKHRTKIGSRVKVSVDTTFMAPGERRRRGVHGGRIGDRGRRPAGSARRLPGGRALAAAQRRGVRPAPQGARRGRSEGARAEPRLGGSGQSVPGPLADLITSAPGRKLAATMSILQTRVTPTDLPFEYNKRLMLFSGRANPALAARIASKLGVELGGVTLKTFANGEVYCRFEESVRGADVFIVQPTCANPDEDLGANDALMELLDVDRRGRRWLGAPRDRRHPLVRLLAAGQEVRAPGADHRAARGADARDRRNRPDPDDGSPPGPDPGILQEAVRPHDRAVHAHPVLRGPRCSRTSSWSRRTPVA